MVTRQWLASPAADLPPTRCRQPAHQGRGAADGGQLRQAPEPVAADLKGRPATYPSRVSFNLRNAQKTTSLAGISALIRLFNKRSYRDRQN
jgi:hypothetical protein